MQLTKTVSISIIAGIIGGLIVFSGIALLGTMEYSNDSSFVTEKELVTSNVADLLRHYNTYGEGYFGIINNAPSEHMTKFYPFVVDFETLTIIAHGADPTYVGQKSHAVENADRPLSKIKSDLVNDGYTWITYEWENPETQKIQQKKSLLVLHDGYIFGSGYYVD